MSREQTPEEQAIEAEHALKVARENLRLWLNIERGQYADSKFDVEKRMLGFEKMHEEGLVDGGYEFRVRNAPLPR